jgi:hypothetical protein
MGSHVSVVKFVCMAAFWRAYCFAVVELLLCWHDVTLPKIGVCGAREKRRIEIRRRRKTIERSELAKLPRVQAAFIEPMRAKLFEKLPEGEDWEYQAKLDVSSPCVEEQGSNGPSGLWKYVFPTP